MAIELLKAQETANADLYAAAVEVLRYTPDASNARRVQIMAFLGNGVLDLGGDGGNYELTVSLGDWQFDGGAQIRVLGTATQAALVSSEFVVPAGLEVVVDLQSPNSDDDHVYVNTKLYST